MKISKIHFFGLILFVSIICPSLYGNDETIPSLTELFPNHTELLMTSIKQNDTEKVTFILHHFPEMVDNTDQEGCTPLHRACQRGHVETIKSLIQAGANPTIKDKKGNNIFHAIVMSSNPSIIKGLYLSYQKTKYRDAINQMVNAPNNVHNRTPLLHACRKHKSMVQKSFDLHDTPTLVKIFYALRCIGAKPEIKDKDGKTALNWLEKSKQCNNISSTEYHQLRTILTQDLKSSKVEKLLKKVSPKPTSKITKIRK